MLLIPLALPVLGAIALFAWRPENLRRCHGLTLAVTLATSLLTAWCVLSPGDHAVTLLQVTPNLSVSFRLDDLGRVFASLAAFLWPLATLYAFSYMAHEGGENVFFGQYMLSYAVTLAIAFAEDLATLYLFYELLTLSTLFMVMHGMPTKRVYAGRKYVYYCLGGAGLAFVAMVTVAHYGGGADFTPGGIAALRQAPLGVLLPVFVMGFMGFGVKAAVFPLHNWLPTVSVAPTPVTALLHAVAVVKAGAFAVIRLAYSCYGAELLRGTWAQAVCLGVALVSILWGSAAAVRETHMKRRLAYSTMSNLSYVLFGALLLSPEGLTGGLMHMVYHALMKICLFSCVGAVMVQTSRNYVQEMRGLARRMPFIMAVYLFCAVELVGIPPFVGFQSKWALATAAVQSGALVGTLGSAVLIVSAVLTAIYALFPAISAYASPLEGDLEARGYDPGPCMKAPLAVLCVLMLVLAFASGPLTQALSGVAAGLV